MELWTNRHIKTVIILNVVAVVLLLVYIFHCLTSTWFPDGHLTDKEFNLWWPLTIIMSVLAFVVINLQITMDVILFKRFSNCNKAIEWCRLWLKMTTSFQVILILSFLSSIFYTNQENPLMEMTVIIGNISCRAMGLYLINLQVMELTTMSQGQGQGQGYDWENQLSNLPPPFFNNQPGHSAWTRGSV